MDITWLGHSSFRIKGREGVVVTDPFNPKMVGLEWKNPKADMVTVSHGHEDHNYVNGVKPTNGREDKGVYIIDGPGEYEVQGVMIRGWNTFHDNNDGEKRGTNVIYLIELDRLTVLHCGDLGHELSEELLEDIGQVDVMLIPVGGIYTMDGKTAAKVTKLISPAIVVPMHYQIPGLNPQGFNQLTGIGEFTKELGLEPGMPQEKLTVAVANLPEDTQLVVLKI